MSEPRATFYYMLQCIVGITVSKGAVRKGAMALLAAALAFLRASAFGRVSLERRLRWLEHITGGGSTLTAGPGFRAANGLMPWKNQATPAYNDAEPNSKPTNEQDRGPCGKLGYVELGCELRWAEVS